MKLLVFFFGFLSLLQLVYSLLDRLRSAEFLEIYETPYEKLVCILEVASLAVEKADSRDFTYIYCPETNYKQDYNELLMKKVSKSEKVELVRRLNEIIRRINKIVNESERRDLIDFIKKHFSRVLKDSSLGLPQLKQKIDVDLLFSELEKAFTCYVKSASSLSKTFLPPIDMTVGEAFCKLEVCVYMETNMKNLPELVSRFKKLAFKALELEPDFAEFDCYLHAAYPQFFDILHQKKIDTEELLKIIAKLQVSEKPEEKIEGKKLEKIFSDFVGKRKPAVKKRVKFQDKPQIQEFNVSSAIFEEPIEILGKKKSSDKDEVLFHTTSTILPQSPENKDSKKIDVSQQNLKNQSSSPQIASKIDTQVKNSASENNSDKKKSSGGTTSASAQKKQSFYHKLWFKILFTVIACLILFGAIFGLLFWIRSRSKLTTKTKSTKQEISDF